MRTLFAGLIAILLAGCATDSTREQVQPLVNAAWLNGHLGDVVVLDIRYGAPEGADREVFESGHIAGAVYASYTKRPWRVEREGVPGMMPAIDDLERLIGSLGVSNVDHVVIVVSGGTSAGALGAATRLYWQFKVLGHEAVSILDGGYAAWTAAGYQVESGWSEPVAKEFTAEYWPDLVADKDAVIVAREAGVPLIDARSASYFSGARKSRLQARFGTIDGAHNISAQDCTADSGSTFVDATTAEALWEAAGLSVEGDQIAFCNTGHTASLAWFTAYEILGNKDARLYDGSLAEWSADPQLPMEAELEPVGN